MAETGEQERSEQTITQFISRWKGVRMIEANGVIAAIITIIGVIILFRELNTNILWINLIFMLWTWRAFWGKWSISRITENIFLTSRDLLLLLAECDGWYLPSDCRDQAYYRTGILGGIASLHNIRVISNDSTTLCSKLAKLDLHNLYIQLSPSWDQFGYNNYQWVLLNTEVSTESSNFAAK